MFKHRVTAAWTLAIMLYTSAALAGPVADTPFVQEYHEAYPFGKAAEGNPADAVALDASGDVWTLAAGAAYRLDKGTREWARERDGAPDFAIETKHARAAAFTPADGIPFTEVRCVMTAPDGRVWVGTPSGICRYDREGWSLRHSRRWLLDDDVRDIAVDADGTVWAATARGASAIKQRTMMLADKAAYFHEICLKRHVREPWLVESCRLKTPGDVASWEPADDDNDGQYTAMYLMMESCHYAVTRDPEALVHAKRAFDALRFLQTVTDTPGFVARSVVPSTWTRMADNQTFTDAQWAQMQAKDPRY
ncbi:MAG TPA: hypothetical protein ENN80_13990, partial [Candidatus Hydrogenedentes bacterium]|nr:hypothetical protein [Candidatus Hydrogenedentota bacterium]